MRPLRLALALAVPTARATRKAPFLAAAATGLLLIVVPAAWGSTLDPDSLTLQLRLATLCAAVGLVFLLDDPAKPTTVVVSGPAWVQTAVRVVLAVVATAIWWLVAVAIVLVGAKHGAGGLLRLPGTTLEAASIMALALALGVAGHRAAQSGVAGALTAPLVLVLVGAAALLPRGLALFVGVTDPRWAAAHERWWGVLAVACAALLLGSARR